MAPNLLGNSTLFLAETNSAEPIQIISKPGLQDVLPQVKPQISSRSSVSQYRWQIVWRNVLIFIYLHIAGIYGLYYAIAQAQWKTLLWGYLVILASGIGVTAGAHRLWAHRTYKAKLPLRIYLAFCQTVALQNDIYEWVRDHRVHHKFTDTDADPHNSNRGFFFSHMGWLLVKKHKDVFVKGKTVDMSDVEADPVVRFQRKYYIILTPILTFVFPAIVPWYFWNETPTVCFYSVAIFRYILTLHGTWLVNSAAHIWGYRPYDKNINATENKSVSILAFGEGWHNYHHVFPWDYKAAELGNYRMNFTTAFLDLMSKIGQAYDLKTVSVDMINKRRKRTGDGTGLVDEELLENEDKHHHHHDDSIWGWGDKDMKQDDMDMVQVHNPSREKFD
ncbi:acyl-CoA Delta(11) desaturase-like isoform X1 [Tribolium castaneum]|uniref:Acyl-CoA Delta(11) desaturase-like Protein n=1 Tax=Tribolium castaneum TaxID=7070 RepID=D7EJN2_TRICA|nr:acyl-CoA Delta(11) desaturase-like [Tribolium castaneum]XP_008197185.1 PREDICTED: acyl-CoA Delta(11) desaturase-like isoform X1 [Tribolium castaneum]XP_008197190.1 PREDICTED: acyl-CoA Delta(11) desaturase-like isoform X1 [Tribolium castaneum]AHH30815.1 fatty acid desaturase D8 [Tribolium castaneum]EFA12799.1 Acyl-CoA Delta(11) desaturase-like Protein [Tribolium castaneum]|eukprot:NP_001306192.1 acyl-CoA Delta(11) desaturase-like [Tribolium castaneum]